MYCLNTCTPHTPPYARCICNVKKVESIIIIRKYGSTFYIGISMVVYHILADGKLKFQFSLSIYTQFDFYQHQDGEHVES